MYPIPSAPYASPTNAVAVPVGVDPSKPVVGVVYPHHLPPVGYTDNPCAIPDSRAHAQGYVTGRWETKLDDSINDCGPNGCMACWLPCVPIAQVSARIGVGSFGSTLLTQLLLYLAMLGLVAIEVVYYVRWMASKYDGEPGTEEIPTLWASVFAGVVVVVVAIYCAVLARLRTQVRDRFLIAGSFSSDFWTAFCCGRRVIAQLVTQTKSSTGPCDLSAPEQLPAHIP